MFQKSDPYTFTTAGQLQGADKVAIGLFSSEYQVTHYDEVQLSSGVVQSGVEDPGTRRYLLSCTQRIKIYNPTGTNLRPQTTVSSYLNYPALLNTSIQVLSQTGMKLDLINYEPQTVNTQVQTSGTTGSSTGQTSSSSTSNTIGSSTSQTNSYGVSVGFFGDLPTASVSAEHSTTTSHENSTTVGKENSQSSGKESSASASMSMKDWGAYCLINPSISSPSWTFGQEYPWDAIECRKTTGATNPSNPEQVKMVVPSTQLVRLYDGVSLYPPSHLSMFGVNFVQKAQWLITITNGQSDTVNLKHIVNYFSASHTVPAGSSTAVVYLDTAPTLLAVPSPGSLSNSLDLGVMGLAPLNDGNGPAVVGFLPAKFTVKPVPAGTSTAPVKFKAFSPSNTLRVTDTTTYPSQPPKGTGFAASETSMTATMSGTCTQLKMSLLFKIIDVTTNYTLYIKHWKASDVGVMLSIVINGDTDTTLVKYVDSVEAEGGENNLLAIALRDLNVTSVDFHDYLTLGLNSIDITITPINKTGPCTYQVRALSVEPV